MKASKLKVIYQSATLAKSPSLAVDTFSYFDGSDYLLISRQILSESELCLLESMMSQNIINSEWHDYLVSGLNNEISYKKPLSIIYFYSKGLESKKQQWLNSFQAFFEDVIEAFFIKDSYGIIIIESFNKTIKELEGYINMLDDDFSTLTSVLVGLQGSLANIQSIFKEEEQLFHKYKQSSRVLSFSDLFIKAYIAPSLKESAISQHIKSVLINDEDAIALIKSLWKNQGNQSVVASDLFIHRNTVNYRIDKLYAETNLDLRDNQQLLLCYVLVI